MSLVAVVLLLPTGLAVGAAPPRPPEPLKGAVREGVVSVCVEGEVSIDRWGQPIRGGGAHHTESLCSFVDGVPLRWHVKHGALWLAGSSPGFGAQLIWDGPIHYDLRELAQAEAAPGSEQEQASFRVKSRLPRSSTLSACRFLSQSAEFEPAVHYDYLPTGRFSLSMLLLTNVQDPSRRGKGTKALGVQMFPRDGPKKPQWSFVLHSMSVRWNERDVDWKTDGWKAEGTFDVAFREPFQALSRGEDIYFLTNTGRLFRSPKPAKGTHRKLETVWDDAESRIVAHIHDADRDRTFLFCDTGPKGVGGPIVFELGSGVRPRFYEPKLYNEGDQGPKQLRRVVGYARVLEALGYIKGVSAARSK